MSDDGVCQLARYSPRFYLDKLGPYEGAYRVIQGMLFYRRPIPFAVAVIAVELLLFTISALDLGLFAVVSLAIALVAAGRLVFDHFGGAIVARAFPPIDEGAPPVSNRIYPLLPFCQRFSHISSTVVDALERAYDANRAGSVKALAATTAVFGALFVFFNAVGTFWPVFVIVQLALFAPGIVMHPKVFPYAEPYILKFAKAIKCPYCQPKTE
jgi:hypothetical protein